MRSPPNKPLQLTSQRVFQSTRGSVGIENVGASGRAAEARS